jgi:arsenate reductase (thioredoxin)
MKILFLSLRNCCRSQIAEAILRQIDKNLELHSAGIDPAPDINPVAIAVMKEVGVTIEDKKPLDYQSFLDIDFDFLITVGDGTTEELKLPPLKFKRKIHLGFHNPFTGCSDEDTLMQNCREIRDEISVELEYFYQRILKPLM